MKNAKWIIGAATLITSVGLAGMPAMAASATLTGCNRSATQLETALQKNQNSTHYKEAQRLRRAGLQYCHAGLYKMGVSRYSAALKLLGADEAAATPADKSS